MEDLHDLALSAAQLFGVEVLCHLSLLVRDPEVVGSGSAAREAAAAMLKNHHCSILSTYGPGVKGVSGGAYSSPMSILTTIGRTDLVPLSRLAPEGGAKVLLKLEYQNPTGSMKDRMAVAMVEGAQSDGRLQPGGAVVEYTAGSTGVSLAFVCAAKRIPLELVTSDAFSLEKRQHMEALGARLHLVRSPDGGSSRAQTLEMIDRARQLASSPGSYWTDQLNNTDQLSCYGPMADEIWGQCDGHVDAFVEIVGTGGSLRGIGTRLRELDSNVKVVAVEPAESAVLSGGASGVHGIEGAGAGFVVPLWSAMLADRIERVSTAEAMETARRLAREEGILAGTSTGANVAAALRVAATLAPSQSVVTIAIDSGMKYLSTALYRGSTSP
jgi:cysteine synthase A